MQKKILTLLVLLMTAVTGAVAQTPELLVTIESRQNSDFTSGSKTFDDKATVTFSNPVYNWGDADGWYADESLLTVAGANGYTITSCKFYTDGGPADTGYTIEGESPSVYLIYSEVYTDNSQSVFLGYSGITKIEVYGYAPAPAGPTEYYLVGNITSWGIDPQYKLALNESAGDANEYQIAVALPAATELKVVSSTDGTNIKDWFPAEAGNYTVTADGLYTIYFRPGYNGGSDWHAGCIYVADGVSFTADGTAWTLAQMPACDLEMEVEYYPLATLATTPAAAEGLNDATTADLLTPGTSNEGTLYYALGTSEAPTGQWSTDIPTTQGLEAGEHYVWYKVVGDDQHSDSEPQSIAVTVAALPAFAVTIDDAGVDASNWQATPAEQRAGQTVTLSYSGKKKVRSITIEAAPAPAEGHALSASAVGDIVCSDGKAYAAADKDNLPQGVTAVAMIAYVGSETGVDGYTHGLALALTDEASTMNWTNATGASGAAAHTPAAPTTITSSWMLPSKNQWEQMFAAFGGNSGSYTGLNTAIGNAGGTALVVGNNGSHYWTSTKYNDSRAYTAYLVSGQVGLGHQGMNYDYYVRACLAW